MLAIRFFVYRSETLHFLIFLISSIVCMCVCVCLAMTSIPPEKTSHTLCLGLIVALIQLVDRCKMLSVAIMTQSLVFLSVVISFYFLVHCLASSLRLPHCLALSLFPHLPSSSSFSGVNGAVLEVMWVLICVGGQIWECLIVKAPCCGFYS